MDQRVEHERELHGDYPRFVPIPGAAAVALERSGESLLARGADRGSLIE